MHSQPEHKSFSQRRRSRLALGIALPCMLAGQGIYAQASQQSTAPTDDILEYVIVTGSQVQLPPDYAGGQVARGGRVGLFGNLDLMDTPFNSTNYTAEFMRNLQARSVADVVQSDPGVRVARGFGNFQELYVVRGFPVYSDDMSYNGLYGLLPRQYVAAEFLERVEVFRGANSFLNGAAPTGSGIGGNFNLVPKRAPDNPLNRLTVGFENQGAGYMAADFARRFGANDGFGIRANAARRDGETSVDNQDRQLSMFSLGVDYRGERGRFSADLGYQDHNIDAPRPSVTPVGSSVPRAPDASSNFAQNWTFSGEKDFFGVARGEFDVTENTDIWAAAGLRDSEEHNILANPNADAAGAISSYRFENYREDLIATGEIGLRTQFDIGSVGHRVSIQASTYKSDSKNAYGFSWPPVDTGSLYDSEQVPMPTGLITGGVMFSPKTTSKIETSSVALADTLAFMDERVLVTLGARYQVVEQHSYDYNTGAENCQSFVDRPTICGYDASTVTPVAGLVVKPSDEISLYANYIEGLIPGEIVPATVNGVPVVNAGDIFDPFASEQIEVGAKYDGGTLGGTLSIFRVNKPRTVLGDDRVVRESGEQRNQGVELSMYGQLVPTLRVLGGATFLKAENTKTQGGIDQGKTVIGVPETQANIGVEWDLLTSLSVDGRVVYTSSQMANASNTLEIPGWTRLDLGARYSLAWADKTMTVRARIDNVTDRNYWASVGGSFDANYMVLGGPRTFVLSASLDF